MKQNIRALLWLALPVAIFTLIVCAVPVVVGILLASGKISDINAMHIVAYIFGVIAILTGWYTIRLTFKRGNDAKSQFYGFPILRVGAIYVSVQLTASILSIIFADYLPVGILAPVFVVLFCVAAAGLATTAATRDEIQRQDVELKKKVSKMRELQSLGNTMLRHCEDAELRKELQKFSDALRYSDPVSSDALEAIEYDLTACMQDLQTAVVDADNAAAMQLCKRAQNLLTERNRLCKLNK